MNKELIQQFLDRSCYDEQDQRELEDWCNVEKLTKLIVQECANVADRYVVDGDIDIAEIIKRHFGVE